MRLLQVDLSTDKGWLTGGWNSQTDIAIGFANTGVDEPHLHENITEIYLVASGNAEVRVENRSIELSAGHVLIIEPGEAHTFLKSSSDYLHFVVHIPLSSIVQNSKDKKTVARRRLGL